MSNTKQSGLLIVSVMACIGFFACGNDDKQQQPGQVGSLYDKYGGASTIRKVVDDAVTGVIADCTQNPFFTQNVINFDDVSRDGNGHGSNGHDTVDRLKSCLDSQFTAAFGGPSPYNGTKTVSGIPSRSIPGQTYDCEDMTATHADIGVNPEVFDQFITDVGSVMKKDGVSDADIGTVAGLLVGFKPQIVAPPASQKHFDFQPGQPANQPAVACSVAAPSATPSSSPSPSPSPISSP